MSKQFNMGKTTIEQIVTGKIWDIATGQPLFGRTQ